MKYADRVALARTLRAHKDAIADEVTQAFFERHPDWRERYGDMGWQRGLEDAAFHVDFLGAAIESDSEAQFAEYARWTARVLSARHIDPRFVAENLEQVREAVRSRVNGADMEKVTTIIDAGVQALAPDAIADVITDSESSLTLARNMYLQALLAGQRVAALNVAREALREGSLPRQVYVDVIQEAMYEVGRRWERNEIGVAQEHMATAITQFVLARMYQEMLTVPPTRGRIVLTGVEGEEHQVGLSMLADVLEVNGFEVRFLGTNLPRQSVVDVVRTLTPVVLGVSVTMPYNVGAVEHLVTDVRSQLGTRAPRVVVGGRAFAHAPELYKELGADAYARDLRDAVEVVEGLATR